MHERLVLGYLMCVINMRNLLLPFLFSLPFSSPHLSVYIKKARSTDSLTDLTRLDASPFDHVRSPTGGRGFVGNRNGIAVGGSGDNGNGGGGGRGRGNGSGRGGRGGVRMTVAAANANTNANGSGKGSTPNETDNNNNDQNSNSNTNGAAGGASGGAVRTGTTRTATLRASASNSSDGSDDEDGSSGDEDELEALAEFTATNNRGSGIKRMSGSSTVCSAKILNASDRDSGRLWLELKCVPLVCLPSSS